MTGMSTISLTNNAGIFSRSPSCFERDVPIRLVIKLSQSSTLTKSTFAEEIVQPRSGCVLARLFGRLSRAIRFLKEIGSVDRDEWVIWH